MNTAQSQSVRTLRCSVDVSAGIDEVWAAWTTESGIRSFFAPACRIELCPDGLFEILFDPDAEPGSQGAEGTRIMAMQSPGFLSFSWTFPPSLQPIRDQRTLVTISLQELSEKTTRVTLDQIGWAEGELWDKGFEYFEYAWGKIVLPRLRYRFEVGPLDWGNPPKL